MHFCFTYIIVSCRYPSLRVAYVEEKEKIVSEKEKIVSDRPPTVYSSVLVKAVNGFDQVPPLICAAF